jgi:putative addiction module component (TIGR02574 family)
MVDIKEIKKLSITERILLVDAIWDSIEDDPSKDPFPLTEEQKRELERRIQAYKRGESKVYTWEAIKNKLKISE